MTPRDAEALRRIATIERAFAALLVSPHWEPHIFTEHFGVFASKWPAKRRRLLWTIVNRNHYDVEGRQWCCRTSQGAVTSICGTERSSHPQARGEQSCLEFSLEADGYGAVWNLAVDDAGLSKAADDNARTSARTSQQHSPGNGTLCRSRLVEIAPTGGIGRIRREWSKFPKAISSFSVTGIEIEGMNDEGVDVQYPWETVGPPLSHTANSHHFVLDRQVSGHQC